MKALTNLLGALALSGAVLTGCNNNYATLHENKGTEIGYVRKGDNYSQYANELKVKYPVKLKDVSRDNLVDYLWEINDHKELKADGKVKLPVY